MCYDLQFLSIIIQILLGTILQILLDAHGQQWNLRKFASFSCQLQVNAARMSHFLDAEIFASFIAVHVRIDIVGQASLDE